MFSERWLDSLDKMYADAKPRRISVNMAAHNAWDVGTTVLFHVPEIDRWIAYENIKQDKVGAYIEVTVG